MHDAIVGRRSSTVTGGSEWCRCSRPIGGILLARFWWGSVFLVNVPDVFLLLQYPQGVQDEAIATVPSRARPRERGA